MPDFIREKLWELGKKAPYFRYISFPITKYCYQCGPKYVSEEENICECGNNMEDKPYAKRGWYAIGGPIETAEM